MKEEFDVIRVELGEIISPFLGKQLNQIDNEVHFINNIKVLIERHLLNLEHLSENELKFYNEVKCFNTLFLELLNTRDGEEASDNFDQDFSELSDRYEDFFRMTDTKRKEYQNSERFKIITGDSILIKILKVVKWAAYFITSFYGRANNLIRKIFKQYEKPLRQWKRKIYFRNFLKLVIKNRLLLKYLEILREMNKDVISALHTSWMAEEKINIHFTEGLLENKIETFVPGKIKTAEYEREINSALKILQKTKDGFKQNAEKLLDDIINELDILYQKAGTIEFLSWHYSKRIVEKEYNDLMVKYKVSLKGWDNAFYVLFEDWKFSKELHINELLNVQEMHHLKEESRQIIISRIIHVLEEVEKQLMESKNRIENQNNLIGLSGILSEEKLILSEYLKQNLISRITDILLDEQIPESVDKFEVNIKAIFEKIPSKRAVVKSELYEREIRTTEIEYIDPIKVIGFKIFPEFLKETNKLKSSIVEQMDKIQKELNEIQVIANFSLESAVALIESDKIDHSGNKPESVAVEGLHRAISKVYEIKSLLLHVYENIINSSSGAIASLNERLLQLPKAEEVIESGLNSDKLNVRKEEKTPDSLNHEFSSGKFSEQISHSLIKPDKNIKTVSDSKQKKIRVSEEIRNCISENGSIINKLPYVYQKLFRIEPLENEKFYEPCEKEMSLLNSSFESWRNGKYSPVVLVGEQGSGITTIINIFFKKNPDISDLYEIIKGKADGTYIGEEELLRFLGILLRVNSADKYDIINFLNMPGKKIIVLEKIQHLFLRKIGGFKALKLLFEIISATCKNVYWLLTSNVYAWNYIDGVLNIREYFSDIIRSDPLSDKQLNDIIYRRHRVSGYNIIFKPSSNDSQNKKYVKLNFVMKQDYLKEKYFSQLNKFAKGNVGISLLFWIRSINEVKNDTITISSFEDLNFSFLSGLNEEKIFTLNSLIVHDGLTPENHSVIFNQDIEKSRHTFHLLNDDGIITKNKIGYIINPVFYRHTVRFLQTKNILY